MAKSEGWNRMYRKYHRRRGLFLNEDDMTVVRAIDRQKQLQVAKQNKATLTRAWKPVNKNILPVKQTLEQVQEEAKQHQIIKREVKMRERELRQFTRQHKYQPDLTVAPAKSKITEIMESDPMLVKADKKVIKTIDFAVKHAERALPRSAVNLLLKLRAHPRGTLMATAGLGLFLFSWATQGHKIYNATPADKGQRVY